MNFFFFLPLILLSQNICVCLNVKNDEKTILTCLESLKEIASCLSVCDCDSKDQTLALIDEFTTKNHIKKNVHKGQDLFKEGKNTLKKCGYALNDSYLLFIEPNEKLQILPSNKSEKLEKEAYALLRRSSLLEYFNTQPSLFKASVEKAQEIVTFDSLLVHPQDEIKGDQLGRMARALSHIVETHDAEAKLILECADSNFALKNYSEAISHYQRLQKRSEKKEEIWFAKYMVGECFREMKEWEKAFQAYTDAYEFFPARCEPLQKIALHERENHHHELALDYATRAKALPKAQSFIFPSVHQYLLDEEISIDAYYIGEKEAGYNAANRLILRKNAPKHIQTQAYNNILFYVPGLKIEKVYPLPIQLPALCEGKTYNPMNPAIYKTKNGYKINCRTINYALYDDLEKDCYMIDSSDMTGLVITKNFFMECDADFNILSQKEVIENLKRPHYQGFYHACGLEDCRLFQWKNKLWCSCTTCDTNPAGCRQISLATLNERPSSVFVESLIPLKGPDDNRCEKNWLPFLKKGQLHLIYSYDPFVIYTPDLKTGECKILLKEESKLNFSEFRGSAGPIEWNSGYLLLVHEVARPQKMERYYLHRFLFLDKELHITKISKPFVFLHKGIEFCASMTIDHSGKKLIMPIGVEDREAHICVVDLKEVSNMLEPISAIQ